MSCDCGERKVEMRGVPLEVALQAVAYVFAKRGEIELTYDNQWRCPVCAAKPAFWAITDPDDEDERATTQSG